MNEILILTILTIITAATPLVYAAIGELVVERSGVLNLGVEGMMLAGAVCSFATAHYTGSGMAGMSLQSSQVATGLALTIFGVGLSALIGQPLVGIAFDGLPSLNIPLLSNLPVVGQLLFSHDILVYGSFILVAAVAWFLNKSRAGLVLRSIGDSHNAAHALGLKVIRVRYCATLFGGACAGIGGSYLSLVYTPMWVENMSAGRGWIALALVVFAVWQPGRLLLGAYLFGGISILQLHAQALGINVPSQLMSMLPYATTILVLVLISRDRGRIRRNAPGQYRSSISSYDLGPT